MAKNRTQSDCFPPIELVRDILARQPADWEYPALNGLTEIPLMRADGTILNTPGYDPPTGFYYAPDPDLVIPETPENQSSDHVEIARDLIEEMICDFPVVDQASTAVAIAGMITSLVKCAINDPTPLQVNDAPQAGTGKSLGAEIHSIIITGRAEMFSAPKDEDEWRKQSRRRCCQERASSYSTTSCAPLILLSCVRHLRRLYMLIGPSGLTTRFASG